MIRLEGDYTHIGVISAPDYGNYNNGQPGIKFTIQLSPSTANLLMRLEKMEQEWQEQKRFIESNAAVKNAWNNYQLLAQLAAKETA